MTPEQLTDEISRHHAQTVRALVLFGSAVIHDETKRMSDFNIMMVLQDDDVATLNRLRPVVKAWTKKGNPAPVLLTEPQLQASKDVFPIEFMDIQKSHRVLFGADFFSGLHIEKTHLRHQLEFELRGKLIHLRMQYLELEGKALRESLAKSLSSFATLFKGVLWMLDKPVPSRKEEVWSELGRHAAIDSAVFHEIFESRNTRAPGKTGDSPENLFSRFSKSIQAVVDCVESYQ